MNKTIRIVLYAIAYVSIAASCYPKKGTHYGNSEAVDNCIIVDSLCPSAFFTDWAKGDSINRFSRSKYMYHLMTKDSIGIRDCLNQFIGVDSNCVIKYFGNPDNVYQSSMTTKLNYNINYTHFSESQFEFVFIISEGVVIKYTYSIP